MSGPRTRRTAARKKARPAQTINNAHYVGYVEENESIEAIMKKFEELARMEEEFAVRSVATAAASTSTPGEDGSDHTMDAGEGSSSAVTSSEVTTAVQETPTRNGFTDEQLQEVFKRTSGFTVRSMLRDTPDDIYEEEMWQANIADEDYLYDFEEEDDYMMAMDDQFWDDEFGTGPRKRGRRAAADKEPRLPREPKIKGERKRAMGSDRESILERYKIMQLRLQDRNGTVVTIKKRISTLDPSMPTYIRIPPVPIPRSWIHPIRKYEPPVEVSPEGSHYLETKRILDLDLKEFGTDYQAIYMDPPLLREGETPGPNKLTIEELATLDLNSILPRGFLFIWIEKEFLPSIVELADKQWQMRYVENFCWVKRNLNNVIARDPSRYFNSSKVSLLIFRKEGDVELRHQRSPDCVFDFIKPTLMDQELSEEKPRFMYQVIETLLPQAVYSKDTNPYGKKMLELWARPGTRRLGWTSVCQSKVVS